MGVWRFSQGKAIIFTVKSRVLLVSSDKMLSDAFESIASTRDIDIVHLMSASETAPHWGGEDERLAGVIADAISLREKERRYLIDLHRPPGTLC